MIPRRERVKLVDKAVQCQTSLGTGAGPLYNFFINQITLIKEKFETHGYIYPCTKCVERCDHE
jgi:hypothetical protein